jgi:hypothetical protein
MLEEVELSEDETHWLITLGFDRRRPVRSTFEALQSMTPYERAYKTIEIRADTGEVRSMKIRELPATAELK